MTLPEKTNMDGPLFIVRWAFDHKDDGITVTPGVPPEMVESIEGARLLLERPDGKCVDAVVSKISRLCQHPDESLALCLKGNIALEDVPEGTRVFLREGQSGRTD